MSAILATILDFLKVLFYAKLQQILLKLVEKNVFPALYRNIIENRVKRKKLEQIFLKIYSFLFRTLICIINCA